MLCFCKTKVGLISIGLEKVNYDNYDCYNYFIIINFGTIINFYLFFYGHDSL